MSRTRAPLQGTTNVIQFNWPYYAVGAIAFAALAGVSLYTTGALRMAALILLAVALVATGLSLLVTIYAYDLSSLYDLMWLDGLSPRNILSVNAGFDETTKLIASKFPKAELSVCDFYDPARHTEPSIRRARAAYPPYPGTITISNCEIPCEDGSYDLGLAIMTAHEVRDAAERSRLFGELKRGLTADGKIVVVEHVRDVANLLAYNVGAFHFHTRSAWHHTFDSAGLRIAEERKLNPWVTVFYLTRNGTAH